jgi:N-acetylmuramoyl-L-alanine amidase
VKRPRVPVRTAAAFAALAATAACAAPGVTPATPRPEEAPVYVPLTTGLPPIPRVDAAPAIRVIHPTPADARPRTDSAIIYGSVGTGGARLWINGVPVPVAPNGAFLAFLPTPAGGAWELRAEKDGVSTTQTLEYRRPAPAATAPAATPRPASAPEGVFAAPRTGRVTGGADTLATGSDAIYARPTPTGTYRWFFPRGARLAVEERRGAQYRVRLDSGTTAWIDTTAVRLADTTRAPAAPAAARVVAGAAPELRVRAPYAPFLVEASGDTLAVTVYGASPGALEGARGGLVAGYRQEATGTGAVRYRLALSRPVWGYMAFYDRDGSLVVRLRRPPRIDPAAPLRGIRIVVDPGHPPAGATGPTGLYEGDANLAISLPLAEKLRARGAEVILTRTDRAPLDLGPRVRLAVQRDADLLVSVHNNAFGEGQNPFRGQGTSTYWFHPFSAALARALDREIVAVTRLPDLGAKQGNLALVRPTWMPSVLTESMFMPIPEQESALRDPGFLDRLAEAHVRGIEAFLRERAAEGAGATAPAAR